jgi:DNA-binding GntR family transcriptional regulator
LCLDESFIPFYAVQDVEGLDFGRASLFELLEEGSARRIHRVLQCIELSRVDAEAAAILSIDEGSPVILLHRLIMGPDGRPMAYNRLYGPGSKYKFQTEFERIR